jgi:hypothetical protein
MKTANKKVLPGRREIAKGIFFEITHVSTGSQWTVGIVS